MNVYDFDGTIYDGDSTVDFYLFCLRRHPKIIKYCVKQMKGMILYQLRTISKTEMKEQFFSFLNGIPNIEEIMEQFWIKYKRKIKIWYLKQHRDNDIVISASPEFLLNKICSELKIEVLIASDVDAYTGRFRRANCRGEEKVYRFFEEISDTKIEKFYSDSLSDEPLAKLAKEAFFVSKDQIIPWER